jgi:hypothetical protein
MIFLAHSLGGIVVKEVRSSLVPVSPKESTDGVRTGSRVL